MKSSKTPSKQKAKYMKRSKERYPSFNTARQVANRREQLEFDYLDKLNPEERAWLNQFQEEEVITNFSKPPKFNKKQDEQRLLYRKNNARNRDVYGKAKVTHTLDYLGDATNLESLLNYKTRDPGDFGTMEDAMLDYIDSKRAGTLNDEPSED